MDFDPKPDAVRDKGTVSFFGLPMPCRGRSGHLSVDGIVNTVAGASRRLELQGFLDLRLMLDKHGLTIFSVREKYAINIDVYRQLSELTDTVFEITDEIVSFWNTSCLLQSTVKVRGRNLEGILGVKEKKIVLIDPSTKQPTPFPIWFAEKYKIYEKLDVVSDLVSKRKLLSPPANAYNTSIKPRYSDHDENLHVTSSLYYTYCHDTASEAALAGYYRHFQGDICFYPVAEIEVTYLGECRAGDTIKILTWQDDEDVGTLYFDMTVAGNSICQARMKLDIRKYENLASKL